MSEQSKLAKNTVLIGLSKASGFLSLTILLPIMTAKLSGEQYGLLDLITTYGGLLAPIVIMAFDQGAFRYLIDARKNEEYKRGIISTAFFTVLPVFLILVGVYLAISTIFQFQLATELLLYVFSLSLVSFTAFILRGFGRNNLFAISAILQNVLNIAGILIALLVFNAGTGGVLIAYTISGTIASLFNIFSVKIHKYVNIKKVDKNIRRDLFVYSLPTIPNSISWWILSASDRTIISVILGVTANGIYAISNKFASILGVAQGVFGVAWMEAASLNFKKEPKVRDAFFSDIFNKQFAVFGAFALLLMTATGAFFSILINGEFAESYLYVPVLVLSGLFSTITGFYSGVYFAQKATKKTMIMSIQTAIINLVVNLALIWFIGIWAAAISTAVAYGAMALYRYFDIKKHVKITYNKRLLITVFAVFVISSIVYYFNNFYLNIANLLFTIIVSLVINKDMIFSTLKFLKQKLIRPKRNA